MHNVNIRLAMSTDLPSLVKLDKLIFDELSYSSLVFQQFLDVAPTGLFIAESEMAIIGYSLAIRVDGSPNTAWMLSLGISPDKRNQGLGRLLALHTIEDQACRGATQLLLTVDPSNRIAVKLYESLGFTTVQVMKGYFGEREDRIKMLLRLA